MTFITQDIGDLFRGEQNVRRQKAEVWKYLHYLFMQNINIGNFSQPHQIKIYLPSGLQSLNVYEQSVGDTGVIFLQRS